MIEIFSHTLTNSEPLLSIVFAIDNTLVDEIDKLRRYLIEAETLNVEIVVAVFNDEPFREPPGKNNAARIAKSRYLAFTNAGVYPPAGLITTTRGLLEENPKLILHALRLDGTRDHGVFPNPFAMGDWQCMTRETFERIGGYDETLHQAGGIETNLIGRAVLAGCDLAIATERVFHAWHESRWTEDGPRLCEENKQNTIERGIPWIEHWHTEGRGAEFWDRVAHDKARRL